LRTSAVLTIRERVTDRRETDRMPITVRL